MPEAIALVFALFASATPPPPACTHEDGPAPCYWDASQQGNEEGRSFYLWSTADGLTCVTYWDGRGGDC